VRISTPHRYRPLVCLPRRHIDVFKTSDKFVISFHIISFLHGLRKWRTMLCDAGRVMVPYAERAAAAGQDAEGRSERARQLMGRETIGGFAQAIIRQFAIRD
jgi:hypothetical protein